MSAQDAAAAVVLAKTITGALVPLLVLAISGGFTWAIWQTWTLRSLVQTVGGVGKQLGDLESQADAIEESLEAHRIEDADRFAKLETRLSYASVPTSH